MFLFETRSQSPFSMPASPPVVCANCAAAAWALSPSACCLLSNPPKQMAPSLPVQGYRQLHCPSKSTPKLQAGRPFCSLHLPISLLCCSTSPVTSHHPILSSEQQPALWSPWLLIRCLGFLDNKESSQLVPNYFGFCKQEPKG